MELTKKQYWDAFWKKIKLPNKVDLNFSNDFYIAEILNKYLTKNKNKIAFEVGCAPGKWLIYLSEHFNYNVEGCEYLESASKTTDENLKLCRISNYHIYTSDFLDFNPDKKYDVVLSLGFIEHFIDVDNVCKKHADILNPNGILIIGVPKFTGLNWLIANFLDKFNENKILQGHNLDVMNLNNYNNLGEKIGCKNLFVNYIGGFEPALFDLSKAPLWFWIAFQIINLFLNNKLFRNLNIGFYSGYIMAVYKKNE
jgi:2-polyprenyl-3-methyl-5-hydroxy-6-metoxy-1,4-benzoquinol methylase